MEDSLPLLEDSGATNFSDSSDEEESGDASRRSPLENLDVDKLLEERLGQFGSYQKVVFILVSLPTILSGLLPLVSVFTTIVSKHRCFIPGCDDPLAPKYGDAIHFQNFSIPGLENGGHDSCSRFKETESSTCLANNFGKTVISCDSHVYEHDVMNNTITMKYNLVCDKESMVEASQSMYFLGVLAGASVFGQLGDLMGRRPVFMITLAQILISGFASLVAPSVFQYNVWQFLSAMAQVGMFQTCFVLGVELVGHSYRVYCSVIMGLICSCGSPMLASLAYHYRDWEKITIGYLIPSSFFLAYYFILPRSVRWLLANKRYEEAEAELQRVARWNGVSFITKNEFISYRKQKEIEKKESFCDLLMRPRLVIRLLIVFLCWIVVVLTYYGLSLSASTLGGDVFLNFTLVALTDFPGTAICYFSLQHWGRKPSMMASLLISGFACLISSFLPKSMASLHTILYLIGKFGASAAFTVVYLYTSELFPTSVRNLCIGLSSMTGRFGAIVAPYIKSIGTHSGQDWIPLAIFGVSGIVSGSAVIFLQETIGRSLPRTLDEAEAEESQSLKNKQSYNDESSFTKKTRKNY